MMAVVSSGKWGQRKECQTKKSKMLTQIGQFLHELGDFDVVGGADFDLLIVHFAELQTGGENHDRPTHHLKTNNDNY